MSSCSPPNVESARGLPGRCEPRPLEPWSQRKSSLTAPQPPAASEAERILAESYELKPVSLRQTGSESARRLIVADLLPANRFSVCSSFPARAFSAVAAASISACPSLRASGTELLNY